MRKKLIPASSCCGRPLIPGTAKQPNGPLCMWCGQPCDIDFVQDVEVEEPIIVPEDFGH